MLCMYVEDIHSWYTKIKTLDKANTYGESEIVFSEPHKDEHDGLIMNFTDPTGVLWHIYQGN